MTPNALAKAIRALDQTHRLEELAGALVFRCPLSNMTDRESWLALQQQPPAFVESISIIVSGSDVPLAKGQTVIPDEVFQITVQKRTARGEVRFFLADGLKDRNLSSINSASLIRVAEMEPHETFTTLMGRFESWTVDAGAQYATSEGLVSPQKLVRDLTSGAEEVVSDIRPWLQRTPPDVSGTAYAHWKQLASRRLLAALSNEVTYDGSVAYVLTGPPKRTLRAPDVFEDALWDQLHKAAAWIYYEGPRDSAARHILFSNELARAHDDTSLAGVFQRSLESAESAYNAHVKSGSRETLKALADLRKAVFDETQRITQRAQDLASSLWKDVAVAAAPFVLKILSDVSKSPEPIILAVFPILAALYLLFSFGVQVYVNGRYFKHQDDSREVWKRALTVALSVKEIEDLSETPICESLRDYKKVKWAVGFVYVLLVGILLKVGYDHIPTEWWIWIEHTYHAIGHWIARQV